MSEVPPIPIGQVEAICSCCRVARKFPLSSRIDEGDFEALSAIFKQDGQGWIVRWTEDLAEVFCSTCSKEVPERPPVYPYQQAKKCPKCLSPKVATVWEAKRPYPDHEARETIECLCAMCNFPYKCTTADYGRPWWKRIFTKEKK